MEFKCWKLVHKLWVNEHKNCYSFLSNYLIYMQFTSFYSKSYRLLFKPKKSKKAKFSRFCVRITLNDWSLAFCFPTPFGDYPNGSQKEDLEFNFEMFQTVPTEYFQNFPFMKEIMPFTFISSTFLEDFSFTAICPLFNSTFCSIFDLLIVFINCPLYDIQLKYQISHLCKWYSKCI